MKLHPIVDLFPDMDADQFDALVEDIRKYGVLQPVVVVDGQIVDGKHRWRACQQLGIECPTETLALNSTLVDFVVSQNLMRRHLTASQRATVAVDALPHYEQQAKARQGTRNDLRPSGTNAGKSQNRDTKQPDRSGTNTGTDGEAREHAAKAFGVSPRYVSEAKALKQASPELFGRVLAGDVTLTQARRESAQARRHAARVAAAEKAPQQDHRIIVGDFREHAEKIADGSVSLIFTDPPYDRAASKMLPDLAQFAAAKLAPGGSLLCYVGETQLPSALDAFRQHLRYWWTIACIHAGPPTIMREYGIKCGWKPVLWFVRDTRDDVQQMVQDTMSGGREKGAHDWQQAQSEAEYWIERLCPADGLVVDPFLGGGTTAAAAAKLGRDWIGFEIDSGTAAMANARLVQCASAPPLAGAAAAAVT